MANSLFNDCGSGIGQGLEAEDQYAIFLFCRFFFLDSGSMPAFFFAAARAAALLTHVRGVARQGPDERPRPGQHLVEDCRANALYLLKIRDLQIHLA